MTFYSYYLKPCDIHYKYRGRSVRLVHDTIVPPPAPCETFEVNGVKFNMMCVEGGEFMMGATLEQEFYALSDEKPAHRVSLESYYIGETQVTQALWKAVMGTNVYQQRDMVDIRFEVRGDGDDYPMYYISWIDCQMFVRRLSQLTGREFRLPTEAEWEYAARGGNRSQGYRYAGGNDLNEVAWYEDNSDEKIHPVAQKQPNELGIYDMCGNVWEHCNDWYDNKYYSYPPSPSACPTPPPRSSWCWPSSAARWPRPPSSPPTPSWCPPWRG